MTIGKSGAGGAATTGSKRCCIKRKRCDGEGKTLRPGIVCKCDGSYQVEVRPSLWRESWKLHLGTYPIEAEAHVARDLATFLRAQNEGDSKAGGYHFPECVQIFEEFERSWNPQVQDLFRIVDNLSRAGGKTTVCGTKDPDLKRLNAKARSGVKEMMGKFKELYPQEFVPSTGISETSMDEADPRGNQVQTLHPCAPPLGDLKGLLTDEQWNKLGELLEDKGVEYIISTIQHHHHRVQGLAPSLRRELDSDPQVVGNYPPTSNKLIQSQPITLQGIQRTPDHCTNGGPYKPPSSSFETCFPTSLVQQQSSFEMERRYHNGHHKLQESTLLTGRQTLFNPAFPHLDEVMKVPLPNADLDPKSIDVIDNPFDIDNLFDIDKFCNMPSGSFCLDYTQPLR